MVSASVGTAICVASSCVAWLAALVGRRHVNFAAAALTNKNARIARALLSSGEVYAANRRGLAAAQPVGPRNPSSVTGSQARYLEWARSADSIEARGHRTEVAREETYAVSR